MFAHYGRRPAPEDELSCFGRCDTEGSIPTAFERQVSRRPQAPAIQDGDTTLSYSQLNAFANRIAHAILGEREPSGGHPESFAVGLCVGHGSEAMAAALAIIKAGGFCVPLDPTYPTARLEFIIADSSASIIVADAENRPLASHLVAAMATVISTADLEDDLSAENPSLAIGPDTLSNLIYTSGSMGQPKGVMQTHRNMLFSSWLGSQRYAMTTEDRVSLIFTLGFGGFFKIGLITLLSGATLYPYDISKRGMILLPFWLQQNEISFFQSTASTFRQMLECVDTTDSFPRLRLIGIGTEPVQMKDVELFRKHFGHDTTLRIDYCASEMFWLVEGFIDRDSDLDEHAAVPVGYVVDSTTLFIQDDDGNPVQEGEVGEIVAQSRYISPGYWRLPERSKEVFAPAPGGAGERMFMTGDIGRILPNGLLMHLGRKDDMVKIRGYRIELREIESVLLTHPGVKEAVAAGFTTPAGDERLIAYAVPVQDADSTPQVLKDFLSRLLPDYMIPSVILFIDEMPRTGSLKIDRRALPEPDGFRPDLETAYAPPRTDTEESLVKIWSEVFEIEPIGIYDSFLDLGGHSLLATRIVNRIQKMFGQSLSSVALFEASTIAKLAKIIEVGSSTSPGHQLVED